MTSPYLYAKVRAHKQAYATDLGAYNKHLMVWYRIPMLTRAKNTLRFYKICIAHISSVNKKSYIYNHIAIGYDFSIASAKYTQRSDTLQFDGSSK